MRLILEAIKSLLRGIRADLVKLGERVGNAQAAADNAQAAADNSFKLYADGNLIDISAEIPEKKYYNDESLVSVCFPFATSIGDAAFCFCETLTSAECPKATSIGKNAFAGSALTAAKFPLVQEIKEGSFRSCSKLETVDLPKVATIANLAFDYNSNLKALILRNPAVVCAIGLLTFRGTPISLGTGYAYVPAALLESYKVAEVWRSYANQLRALEEYTVDGTIAGELDPNKI